MDILNLTPHAISVRQCDGKILTVPPSGIVARVSVSRTGKGFIEGVPVSDICNGAVTGVPDSVDDRIYLVSSLVATSLPNRADLYVPYDYMRDSSNNILYAASLVRYVKAVKI